MTAPRRDLILVKHALPLIEVDRPPPEWRLGPKDETQALALAERLRAFVPLRLATSPEPKARRTCEVIAEVLGAPMSAIDDLREFDRPVLPWMPPDEHERVNAEIFTSRDRPVLGREWADQALARFDAAVLAELASSDETNLVVVAHGTVISLFAGKYGGVDEFELWRRLERPSLVVMSIPDLEVLVVEVSVP